MDIFATEKKLYVGVDVGGTKIQVSLVGASGRIFARSKHVTPRDCEPALIVAELERVIRNILKVNNLDLSQIAGIGIAVPGVVERDSHFVVVTPNMNLSNTDVGGILASRLGVTVTLGNDGNLGALGEAWLGAGRDAASVLGIFVGTGIGCGIVVGGNLICGAGLSAGEIGHMVMQLPIRHWSKKITLPKRMGKPAAVHVGWEKGMLPKCGCKNLGCLETLCSRSAIERDIRSALAGGAKSVIRQLCAGNLTLIRSGTLAKALKQKDPLVTAIMHYAAEVLGYACLSVRHLLDPEVIILGGGVMEACGDFMMPLIEKVLQKDTLPCATTNRRVTLSSLGDDAIVLGAVALAQMENGECPIIGRRSLIPTYAHIKLHQNGIKVENDLFTGDFYMHSSGKYTRREVQPKKNPHGLRLKDMEKACDSATQLLIFATDFPDEVTLSGKVMDYLNRRGIRLRIMSVPEAVEAFNEEKMHRAAIFHTQTSFPTNNPETSEE